MTYDQALELIDLLTAIARDEIRRSGLDNDEWELADRLYDRIYENHKKAATLLSGSDE